MADQIKVRAVRGRLCPHQAPRAGFVGYAIVNGASERSDHDIPRGHRYRIVAEGESVGNTAYYRRAIARGDIARFEEPVVRKNALREIGE